MKRFSSVIGDEYDLFEKTVPHHDEFQEKIKSLIQTYIKKSTKESITILEGGSGTGKTSERLFTTDKRVRIIGIENEERLMKCAEKRLKKYKKKFTLIPEDILVALRKIESNSVDVFVSVWMLHNLDPRKRKRVLKEVARVLRSRGLFVNGDKCAGENVNQYIAALSRQIKRFDIFNEIGRHDLRMQWMRHYEEDEKIRLTEREIETHLKDLGFRSVKKLYRKELEAVIWAII